jgi:ribosomal protein S18 acetylase RimI-like enzyme
MLSWRRMPIKPLYTARRATDADFLFMRETKLEGLRPYVEAMWGWNREKQEQLFQQDFKPKQSEIIVVAGVDVGFVRVVKGSATMFVGGIYVCASARRRGIGTAILRDLIATSTKQSKPLTLQVLKVNPARRLYERLGFVTTSETSSHFPDGAGTGKLVVRGAETAWRGGAVSVSWRRHVYRQFYAIRNKWQNRFYASNCGRSIASPIRSPAGTTEAHLMCTDQPFRAEPQLGADNAN